MKNLTHYAVLLLVGAFLIIGCSPQAKSANSSEAIKLADSLQTKEEKIQFLVSEANAFLNSQKFEDAIKTSRFVLSQLDSSSEEAKNIVDLAKSKLEAMAKQKAEELKGDMKNTLGNIGQ